MKYGRNSTTEKSGSWIRPSPEKVDRMLQEGTITDAQALSLKKAALQRREGIELRLTLKSLVDDGHLTKAEFIQRVRQFLHARKSEK
jgi:hypothetical protein